jgi:putative FmdB family regulatory protein
MPIYEYLCKKCGSITELIHGLNDTPAVKCSACGAKAERKISSGTFILKGGGWYANDYGNKFKTNKGGDSCPSGKPPGAPACSGCPKNEPK